MFTHTWQPVTDGGQTTLTLRSALQVEHLFAREPERTVLAVVLSTSENRKFLHYDDVWRVLHTYWAVILPQGEHCGDCTKVACSCSRCIAECTYEDALAFEEEVGTRHPDPVALILGTEAECDYAEFVRPVNDARRLVIDFPDTSVDARLALWARLGEDEMAEATRRAAQFRAWLKGGIATLPPYPDNWPKHWDKLK